jgi:FtsH-binding integral membrane protein
VTARAGTEELMNDLEKKKGSGVGVLDAVLITAAVVGGVLVLLWVLKAVAGLILFAFKLAVIVVVVAVIIRLFHLVSRRNR